MSAARIRIGISSCLLGEAVRYDGGHKRDAYTTRTLSRYFEFVPVCPEVGIGLGVPRPPIRLVGEARSPRAIGRDDPTLDVTAELTAYARRCAHRLDDVSGYIFKSRSPSCGLAGVPIQQGSRIRRGRGIYAQAFLARRPWLPVEQEDRLADPEARDNFLERVFACRRWQQLMAGGPTAAKLVKFHEAHELALRAHAHGAASELNRMAARARRGGVRRIASEYIVSFMMALARPAKPAGHTKVLSMLVDYIGDRLEPAEREEIVAAIRSFRNGAATRAKPLALLRHHFQRYPHRFVASQRYLYPDPEERKLRRL